MIYFVHSGDAVKIGYADSPDRRIPTLRTVNPNAIVTRGVAEQRYKAPTKAWS
jgi:hypothetical protein